MLNIQLPNNYAGPSPGFVRATIKISHPDWNDEQINAELQIKMQELLKGSESEGCEWCSS